MKVAFFFPCRGVGGVSLLFLRVAEALVARGHEAVSVIDFPDGYMARNLPSPSVRLLCLEKGRPLDIPPDVLIVMQSVALWRLPDELRPADKTRLFMWHLHPYNLVPAKRLLDPCRTVSEHLVHGLIRSLVIFKKRKMSRLVNLALQNRALAFMDGENRSILERAVGVEIGEPVYLPVPVPDPPGSRKCARLPGNQYGWVGRLGDFKVPILEHAIRRLSALSRSTGRSITFHVGGAGEGTSHITRVAKDLADDRFKVILHGEVSSTEVDRFLLDHVDVLFAMGQVSLEGARLGIPTMLLDFSYQTIVGDYVFRLLPQTMEFTLGRLITPELCGDGNRSLEDILDAVDQDYAGHAQAARNYFSSNHRVEDVVQKFERATRESRFEYGQAKSARLLEPDVVTAAIASLRSLFAQFEPRIA